MCIILLSMTSHCCHSYWVFCLVGVAAWLGIGSWLLSAAWDHVAVQLFGAKPARYLQAFLVLSLFLLFLVPVFFAQRGIHSRHHGMGKSCPLRHHHGDDEYHPGDNGPMHDESDSSPTK